VGGLRFWDRLPFRTVEKKNSEDLKVRARPVYTFVLQPVVIGNGWIELV